MELPFTSGESVFYGVNDVYSIKMVMIIFSTTHNGKMGFHYRKT